MLDFEPPTVHSSGKDFTLAAKFLTKRILNVEAIAKTFSPLWKSQNDFHIKDTSNNILLFVFESDADAERVLVNEPWSFKSIWFFSNVTRITPPSETSSFSSLSSGYNSTTCQSK